MSDKYLFTSARLGFRNWGDADFAPMAAINADPAVREFFPQVQNMAQTQEFIERMQLLMADKGYCYFAVDRLHDGAFIGFTGLADQTFTADFTPCTDIGWRLAKSEWNHGYATEGARRCLQYAFKELGLVRVNAIAPKINLPSVHVMEKIGMHKIKEFVHPLLTGDERLRDCVLYEIDLSPTLDEGEGGVT